LKFYRRNKSVNLYVICICSFFVTILRIFSKKLLINKKSWGTFEDNSVIHVKSVLTMFWREKNVPKYDRGFAPCVFKTIDKNTFIVLSISILLSENNLGIKWYCLNWKKSFLHVHSHSFRTNCQKRWFVSQYVVHFYVYQWYTRIWSTSKRCFYPVLIGLGVRYFDTMRATIYC